jgi:choice-of-anchor B domain-containing protein
MKAIQLFFGLMLTLSLSAQIPCESGFASIWPCDHVDLWRFVPLAEIGGSTATNDIWGWTHQGTGREFALVCKRDGLAFVEITDPGDPTYLGSLPTESTESTWRDVKVFNNYAFVVSEADDHGMQVFDLLQLLDIVGLPVTFVPDVVYDGFSDAHNIVINEESGYAYGVGTDTFGGGLHIVDISDPLNPFAAGSYEESGYTHDAQVVNYIGPDPDHQGIELAVCFNNDHVALVDVTDKTDCFLIADAGYDGVGYTHQGWLTEDHKFMLVDDELDEMNNGTNTRTFIFDVQDLDAPVYVGLYEGPTASIDHNQYIVGAFSYQSNYRAGLRILDIADIENGNIGEVAYFDVQPETDEAGFSGSWSNYAWFPSGNVVCTDTQDGFFVLRPNLLGVEPDVAEVSCLSEVSFELYANVELPGTFSVSFVGLNEGVEVVAPDFTAPGSTVAVVSQLGFLQPGLHEFEFILTTEFAEYSVKAQMDVQATLPLGPSLLLPEDESAVTIEIPELTWFGVGSADAYKIEVASDEDFVDVVFDEITSDLSSFATIPQGMGTYYWHVASINDCGQGVFGETYSFNYDFGITVSELERAGAGIFPNPGSGNFTLTSSTPLGQFSIHDIAGRMVFSGLMNANRLSMDLSHLESGTYLIQSAEFSGSLKLIIE